MRCIRRSARRRKGSVSPRNEPTRQTGGVLVTVLLTGTRAQLTSKLALSRALEEGKKLHPRASRVIGRRLGRAKIAPYYRHFEVS